MVIPRHSPFGEPKQRLKNSLCVAIALMLGACAVGPDFSRPAAPTMAAYVASDERQPDDSDRQRATLGRRIIGEWWTLYRSDDLDRLIKEAIAGSRDLAAARASLTQAAQEARAAGAALYPQADLAASAERNRINYVSTGIQAPNTVFNLYQVGPTVSYALDLFGKVHRQVEEANARAEMTAYQLDGAYLSLTGNVVTQVLTIASLRAQIRATQDIINDDVRNLDLIRRGKDAGVATEVDVRHADSQLAGDRTLLPPLHQQLSAARHALAVLIGREPACWSPPDFELSAFHLHDDLPLSLPSALVRQRPDILAAEADLHAAAAEVGVATANMYPQITLFADVAQAATVPAHLFSAAANGNAIGAALTAPLFHGGALSASKAAAQEAYQASRARYEQTVLLSFAQVADVLQALQHDAEETDAQEKALAAAEASLRFTRAGFGVGSVGVLQVLDAQRQYQQALLGAVRARAQHLMDTAQLFLAMGGGWWEWDGRAGAMPVTPGAAQ